MTKAIWSQIVTTYMHDKKLIDYAPRLAKVAPADARFVILDGSTAEGRASKYSDYDLAVVTRKKLKSETREGLYGVFRGRIISGWLLDGKTFRTRYIGGDDAEFLWRRRQLRKARLLYGNTMEFNRIIRAAASRRWTKKRQFAVVKYAYVTMVEYMGKMLNKESQDETPELYQDAFIVAQNAALIAAALNKIDLDSDKSMYRQIFSEAKVKPTNFERDFLTASGLSHFKRERREVVSASGRLVMWARERLIKSLKNVNLNDVGFWQLVGEIKY